MGYKLLATALRGPTIVLSWLLRQRRGFSPEGCCTARAGTFLARRCSQLTTSVASASPSASSAMIQQRLAHLNDLLEQGQEILHRADLFPRPPWPCELGRVGRTLFSANHSRESVRLVESYG